MNQPQTVQIPRHVWEKLNLEVANLLARVNQLEHSLEPGLGAFARAVHAAADGEKFAAAIEREFKPIKGRASVSAAQKAIGDWLGAAQRGLRSRP